MDIAGSSATIAELFAVNTFYTTNACYTTGVLSIRLKESIRQRYRRYGTTQDDYEFVIDLQGELTVKRARNDGKLLSWWDRLRYGPFARFALISNQARVSPLSLLSHASIPWHANTEPFDRLLAYQVEWKVESSESFYRSFLADRITVCELDVMLAISSHLYAAYATYLPSSIDAIAALSTESGVKQPLDSRDPFAPTTLDAYLIPSLNRRIATLGLCVRHFYHSPTSHWQQEEGSSINGVTPFVLPQATHPLLRGQAARPDRDDALELALLVDGYWLTAADRSSNSQTEDPTPPSGLRLMLKLLEALSHMANASQQKVYLHTLIALDEHITQAFCATSPAPPPLFVLQNVLCEPSTQQVATWLQAWVDRWQRWQIKPYPIDTDISLEKALHYVRCLNWPHTRHPSQRLLLVVGRSHPHEHTKYFAAPASQPHLYTTPTVEPLDPPYHPDDRLSVGDMDWREEVSQLRQSTSTILALCDPALPHRRYHLPTTHPLFRRYQEFWATLDPGILTDLPDRDTAEARPCATIGIDRVLRAIETCLFLQENSPI